MTESGHYEFAWEFNDAPDAGRNTGRGAIFRSASYWVRSHGGYVDSGGVFDE